MKSIAALLLACGTAAAGPAMDARGYLTLDGSQTLDHADLSFGLGALDWGRHMPAAVDNKVSATLVAALGLRIGPVPLELGASLPFTIESGLMDEQAVGDFGAHAKLRLLHVGRIGVGTLASIYLPDGHTDIAGIVDVDLGRLRLGVNGGFDRQGVAAAFALVPNKIEAVAEVFRTTDDGAMAGMKFYLAKNSYMSLGAGRDVADFRGMISIVFEPKPAQRVSHVIPDVVAAEAPPAPPVDADRDNDGIFDRDDKCPDDMEDYDMEEDEDGCPEPSRQRIVDVGSELVTLQPIEFEFDSDVLRDSAYPILDEVVKAFITNPDIKLVEVQGHTDEQGNDAYNMDLSKRRAATVMNYLRDHGIAADRLTSKGYGETAPVDTRHTQAAYKINRRVAFIIKERSK
jgi:outer membrane protein OmpA-like peptidoglycan-associated protein